MEQLICNTETIPGSCGVSTWFDYDDTYWNADGYALTKKDHPEFGGADWTLMGFIERPESYDAYTLVKEKYQFFIQSPVRVNKNSGNKFFWIMLDTSAKKVDNNNYGWPF